MIVIEKDILNKLASNQYSCYYRTYFDVETDSYVRKEGDFTLADILALDLLFDDCPRPYNDFIILNKKDLEKTINCLKKTLGKHKIKVFKKDVDICNLIDFYSADNHKCIARITYLSPDEEYSKDWMGHRFDEWIVKGFRPNALYSTILKDGKISSKKIDRAIKLKTTCPGTIPSYGEYFPKASKDEIEEVSQFHRTEMSKEIAFSKLEELPKWWQNFIKYREALLGYKISLTNNVSKQKLRQSPQYFDWKNAVRERDKVCVCCGNPNDLHIHHINGFSEYPEQAYDLENGVALCSRCHDIYHGIYGKKNITRENFEKFMKRFGV